MVFSPVNVLFWTDPDVIDNFTPEDKYFYLYLLTCPYTNVSGCFQVSTKQMAAELGYSRDTVEHLIERFVVVHRVIDYDSENKEIIVINWGKYHWTSSDKYLKALEKKIAGIKTKKFKDFLVNLYNEFSVEGSFDRVSIGYKYGMDTTYSYSYTSNITDIDKIEGGMGEGREDEVMVFEVDKNDSQVLEDFAKVIKVWNETDFRSVTRLYPKSQRGVWLKARINEYGVEDVIKAIRLANNSQFLKNSGWFDFEWFVRPNNFVKVLEGKYKDGIRNNGTTGYSGNGKKEFHEWDFLEPDVGRES